MLMNDWIIIFERMGYSMTRCYLCRNSIHKISSQMNITQSTLTLHLSHGVVHRKISQSWYSTRCGPQCEEVDSVLQKLQTSKPPGTFKLANDQCVMSSEEWAVIFKSMHLYLTSARNHIQWCESPLLSESWVQKMCLTALRQFTNKRYFNQSLQKASSSFKMTTHRHKHSGLKSSQ